MKILSGDDIRKEFINYFKSKNHSHILSSSIIPHHDPSILFTNAGMNQFKDYFLDIKTPPYKRAVTCQKVIRAGGKHNDLENVGYTDRHHTYFEMLGNFSFGDYFKQQAIKYAWEFLTISLKIPKEKLAVSVYKDDEESLQIWHNIIGISLDRIAKLGEKDNFWVMGDVGPCGPCSELYYDLKGELSGKSVCESLEADDGRFLEIWNLVFMQFDRQKDGTLIDLPNPCIDTGCGLERISSVLQGVQSNYDTDIFKPIIKNITSLSNQEYGTKKEIDIAIRVIADHTRSVAFIISDGVIPSNEGRGYVLRRILRRAFRYASKIEMATGTFTKIVDDYSKTMEEIYPEIGTSKKIISQIIQKEEESYNSTIKSGVLLLDETVRLARKNNSKVVSGKEIFKLYDTYGFPVDLSRELLIDEKMKFDESEFHIEMEKQKQRARQNKSSQSSSSQEKLIFLKNSPETQTFVGYKKLSIETKAIAIFKSNKQIKSVNKNDQFELMLEECPFYPEGGGQVGDQGEILHEQFKINVLNTIKIQDKYIICSCKIKDTVKDNLSINDLNSIQAIVNHEKRKHISFNHTATHLLHSALRSVLGNHIRQAGSDVNNSRFRFDFSHHLPISEQEIIEIEKKINQYIWDNYPIKIENMEYNQAIEIGALAYFGEKYSDNVRVVSIEDFSIELCGGTHTLNTGNISLCKIIKHQGIAAGIKRIEANTSKYAFEYLNNNDRLINNLAKKFFVKPIHLQHKIEALVEKDKRLEKVISKQSNQIAINEINKIINKKNPNQNYTWFDINDDIELKIYTTNLRSINNKGLSVLAKKMTLDETKIVLVVGKDIENKIDVSKIVNNILSKNEGTGGGSKNFAQLSIKKINKVKIEKNINEYFKINY